MNLRKMTIKISLVCDFFVGGHKTENRTKKVAGEMLRKRGWE